MSGEVKKEIQLEIAHVLFIDIVGYSKLSMNEQRAAVDELNHAVRASDEFRKGEAADRLIKIPTGDGMALVFYTSPEAPVQCAIEISRVAHLRLPLRMGVHSGPVSGIVDVNERANLAGAGLNTAQRVMSCGDAGHILVSKRVSEDLAEFEEWRPFLHDLGACEVKHGVKLHVVNLYNDKIGRRELPTKLQTQRRHTARMRSLLGAAALLGVAALLAGIIIFSRTRPSLAPAAPEKSIAVLPFENLSDEKQNAYFADGVQDEILTDLAKIADLKVISRTSVMQYKSDLSRNLREIAEQLGVAHVLEGSVQRIAGRVRVTAQAIARDPTFFLAYCRLAEAHDLIYFFGSDHTPARLALAHAAIEAALRLRPDSGEAHLALAEHLYRGYRDCERALAELTLARRALPNNPLVFELTGFINRRQGRWEESTSDLKRALELDPRNLFLFQQLSFTYELQRRYRDLATVLDQALKLVPSDPETRVARASIDLAERADPKPVHTTIEAVITENPAAATTLAERWFYVALCERDE